MTPNTLAKVGTLAWAERSGGILSRRERIGLLGDAARLQMRILPLRAAASALVATPGMPAAALVCWSSQWCLLLFCKKYPALVV
jgi:hypothetical protein